MPPDDYSLVQDLREFFVDRFEPRLDFFVFCMIAGCGEVFDQILELLIAKIELLGPVGLLDS